MVSPSQDWHYGPATFKPKIVLDTLISRDEARQKRKGEQYLERKCCTEEGRRKTAFHLKEFPQLCKKCLCNIRHQIQPVNWPYFYISGIKEQHLENWHWSKFWVQNKSEQKRMCFAYWERHHSLRARIPAAYSGAQLDQTTGLDIPTALGKGPSPSHPCLE